LTFKSPKMPLSSEAPNTRASKNKPLQAHSGRGN